MKLLYLLSAFIQLPLLILIPLIKTIKNYEFKRRHLKTFSPLEYSPF